MNKHGHVFDWSIVQDERGRVLGKVISQSPLLKTQLETVKKFLIDLQKEKLNEMAKQNEKQVVETFNMVALAGRIKMLKSRDDGSAFILVDPSGDTKYIPCTIHECPELVRRLTGFRVDDTIQLRGFVRAWSQKKNDAWENKTEVRVTEIRNSPPERAPVRPSASGQMQQDDGIPF